MELVQASPYSIASPPGTSLKATKFCYQCGLVCMPPVQAVLLVGFMPQELDAFRAMMNDMDADIVKVWEVAQEAPVSCLPSSNTASLACPV